MGGEQVVLVTGVAGYWGARLADRLQADGFRVLGVDVESPRDRAMELDFVQADVRNPALVDLLRAEGIGVVCHLAWAETMRPSRKAFEANVVGTSALLEACAQAGVRKVVLRSSTAVYGARPGNSALLREDHPLRGSRSWGTVRDLIEIERFCDAFRHRVPDMILTILRFPGVVGPTVDTPLTRFLLEPRAPGLLGFDPMMQVIHEDDVVDALVHAVGRDVAGAVNVAAEDGLPLSKVRGLAGKRPWSVFHPLVYRSGGRRLGNRRDMDRYLPMEPDYLRYPCVGDLTRMRQEMDFAPRYSAEDALREFSERYRRAGTLSRAEFVAQQAGRLGDTIRQRQRRREQQPVVPTGAGEGEDHE